MPTIKIELQEGKSTEALLQIRDSVMDGAIEALRLPSEDRNIRLTEYKKGFFTMKPPYEMLIEISMFAGRSKQTKKELFQTITERLEQICAIKKESVMILLHEEPAENWGIRGGIPADEVDLGFKVDI